MSDNLSIGSIIKRHIKMRGMTIGQTADRLGVNYKTFSGQLNRDAVDAGMLLRLSVLLNIDLEWMAQLYAKPQNKSILDQYQMSRMSSEMREAERVIVLGCLDRHIRENPDSINAVRSALMNDFNQLFYLLDVLLPESYVIGIAVERDGERYYCMPEGGMMLHSIRQPTVSRGVARFYEGNEMLKRLILERKGEIL